MHEAATPPLGAAKAQPRPGTVWRLWASLGLVLLAPGVFWRFRISVIFSDFSEHFQFWTFSAMHRHNKQKLALWHLVDQRGLGDCYVVKT